MLSRDSTQTKNNRHAKRGFKTSSTPRWQFVIVKSRPNEKTYEKWFAASGSVRQVALAPRCVESSLVSRWSRHQDRQLMQWKLCPAIGASPVNAFGLREVRCLVRGDVPPSSQEIGIPSRPVRLRLCKSPFICRRYQSTQCSLAPTRRAKMGPLRECREHDEPHLTVHCHLGCGVLSPATLELVRYSI